MSSKESGVAEAAAVPVEAVATAGVQGDIGSSDSSLKTVDTLDML